MPVLFYLPLIIWMGLFEVAQNEMRPSWKSSRRIGDLAMTKREKGLNGRKVRMGRLVEAQMALICGKVITSLSAADFDHPSGKGAISPPPERFRCVECRTLTPVNAFPKLRD